MNCSEICHATAKREALRRSLTLPLRWVPGRVIAVSSFGVCEAGLLELVLLFGVFFSMNTAMSTFSSISRASTRARLSAVILPSAHSCAKRPWSAPNCSRRDSLLTLTTSSCRGD